MRRLFAFIMILLFAAKTSLAFDEADEQRLRTEALERATKVQESLGKIQHEAEEVAGREYLRSVGKTVDDLTEAERSEYFVARRNGQSEGIKAGTAAYDKLVATNADLHAKFCRLKKIKPKTMTEGKKWREEYVRLMFAYLGNTGSPPDSQPCK